MSDKHRNPAIRAAKAAFIAELLPQIIEPIREVARFHGYAVAVHGSLANDIDLVAVPWVERADDADELARSIMGAVSAIVGRCYTAKAGNAIEWTEKPHGRRAVSLHMVEAFNIWIDLSVMPAVPKVE